jgi:hypothetical protein
LTKEEATELKAKSRRTKQTMAQQRYFKRRRLLPEEPTGVRDASKDEFDALLKHGSLLQNKEELSENDSETSASC